MVETRDIVSIHIDNILKELPSSPSNPTIHRVDDDLRYGNEKLYDPRVVSIGPFHHGKDNLQKMQHHKFLYLKCLMKQHRDSSVDNYVMAMRLLEEKTRKCYSGSVELSHDEFVEMLVLDGFFIVELIRKYRFDELREDDDTIFQYEQLLGRLRHDLMLIENQIPFFVIDQLFTLTKGGYPDEDILYLVHRFFEDVSPWPEASELGAKISTNKADHLFGLVHNIWCSSFAKMTGKKPVKRKKEKIMAITSTAELQESGIEFEKEAESNGIDIKFIGGVMKIPGFCILDETESIFKNLMAYEHFFIDNHPKFMTDYVYFLHCLINSAEDVEILRRRGIVTNFLGDDEMAYRMFNRLGRNINVLSYADVYDQANGKCGNRMSRWMVILRRDYFNNPWSLLKIFAALLVLLLALTQTVYTVLSYVKPK